LGFVQISNPLLVELTENGKVLDVLYWRFELGVYLNI
jgi:hypothetical protein